MPYVTRIITDVPAQYIWWTVHCLMQQRHGIVDMDFSAPIMWHLDLVSPSLLVRVLVPEGTALGGVGLSVQG